MHELSLVQSLLDIIEVQALEHGFEKVNSVKVSFGRIAAIDPQSLEFAFSVQSQGTLAAGADFIIDIKPLIIQCLSCGIKSEIESYEALCPACGAWELEIKSGNEDLQLVELDVDE